MVKRSERRARRRALRAQRAIRRAMRRRGYTVHTHGTFETPYGTVTIHEIERKPRKGKR